MVLVVLDLGVVLVLEVVLAGQIIRILPKLKLQAARFRTPGELQTPSLER